MAVMTELKGPPWTVQARLWLFLILSTATALKTASAHPITHLPAAAAHAHAPQHTADLLGLESTVALFWQDKDILHAQQSADVSAPAVNVQQQGPCAGLGQRMLTWLRAIAQGGGKVRSCGSNQQNLVAVSADQAQSGFSLTVAVADSETGSGRQHQDTRQLVRTSAGRKLLQRVEAWWPSEEDQGSQDQGNQGQPWQQHEAVVFPATALNPAPPQDSSGGGSPGGGMLLFPGDPALLADMQQSMQGAPWQGPDQAPAVRALMAPGDAPAQLPAPELVPAPVPTPAPMPVASFETQEAAQGSPAGSPAAAPGNPGINAVFDASPTVQGIIIAVGVVLGAVFAGTVAGSVIMFATQARRQGRSGPAGGSTTSEGNDIGRESDCRGEPASKRPPPFLVRNPGGDHDMCFAVKEEGRTAASGDAQAADAAALHSGAAEDAEKGEEFHDVAI